MSIIECYATTTHLLLDFRRFLFFLKDFYAHGYGNGRFTIILWSPKIKEQPKENKKKMSYFEEKNIKTLTFKLHNLPHFLFVFNDLKICGYAFWSLETMEQWPKSLHFKSQIVLMSLNQTLILFISKRHILLILKPNLAWILALKTTKQCVQRFLNLYFPPLPSLHPMLQLECNLNVYV